MREGYIHQSSDLCRQTGLLITWRSFRCVSSVHLHSSHACMDAQVAVCRLIWLYRLHSEPVKNEGGKGGLTFSLALLMKVAKM